jgi:branched-chain amino acid transport system permease protein
MQLFLLQFLNGFQLSMLVFLLAVGLTLIFGLMNILNLAHGAFFTMGAYFGLIIAKATGSFWAALLIGPLLPFAAGFVLQFYVLQPLAERGRSTHLDLALLTFGLLFATAGAVEYLYGSVSTASRRRTCSKAVSRCSALSTRPIDYSLSQPVSASRLRCR